MGLRKKINFRIRGFLGKSLFFISFLQDIQKEHSNIEDIRQTNNKITFQFFIL